MENKIEGAETSIFRPRTMRSFCANRISSFSCRGNYSFLNSKKLENFI